MGMPCCHSKVSAAELMLNHMIDREDEFVVDMVAGAEAFASGMFTRFDHMFPVCEPMLRSVGVYRQYAGCAADYDVGITVVGNKLDERRHRVPARARRRGPSGLVLALALRQSRRTGRDRPDHGTG